MNPLKHLLVTETISHCSSIVRSYLEGFEDNMSLYQPYEKYWNVWESFSDCQRMYDKVAGLIYEGLKEL